MNRTVLLTVLLLLAIAAPCVAMERATLAGSPASMVRQNSVAKANEFSFIRTADQVERFVEEGYLVRIEPTGPLQVDDDVSYPVGRPEMKLFLERLAEQYQDGCGEPLVVTSLVRPTTEQPRNSHPLSVHPAGIAVDLRVSSRADCRSWLESALLGLETRGVLDVTRERHPPHYHVALFPDRYAEYVKPLLARDSALAAEKAREEAARLAMASLERVGTPLAATPATEQPRSEGEVSPFAWLSGVVLVLGALGMRRLASTRRREERE